MNLTELIATVIAVGSAVPLVIAVIQRPTWSTRTRTLVAGSLSVVAGAAVYVGAEGLDLSSPSKIVAAVFGVWLAASAAYQGIWSKLGVAQAIEAATTPGAVVIQGEVVPAPVEDVYQQQDTAVEVVGTDLEHFEDDAWDY